MKEFLDNSTLIFSDIKSLNKIVDELSILIKKKQTTMQAEDVEEALDLKIDALDEMFEKKCDEIKRAIRETQEKTRELSKRGEISAQEVEMRNSHTFKYYKELSTAVHNYRNLKSDYKNTEKELLRQAYEIANPKASPEEIEKIIEGKEGSEALEGAFALGTAGSQKMLKQAKQRQKTIENIVKIITRLVTIIKEIDIAVRETGKYVDEIVINVTAAEVNTREANKELESALATRRKINRFKRMLFMGFLFFVGIILLIMVLRSPPNGRGGGGPVYYLLNQDKKNGD